MPDIDLFPKSDLSDMIAGEKDKVEVNGYEVRAVHPAPSEFHLAIYEEDFPDGDKLVGTLDGNRFESVEEMWQACRLQVGLERHEQTLGDLFG